MPLVEEGKQAFKSFISNVKRRILLFQFVNAEHTTIQIRYASVFLHKVLLMAWRIQTIVEQTDQETTIERIVEMPLSFLTFHPSQLVSQVVGIQIEETFLLNEVAEHQAVQHDRGVPLLVAIWYLLRLISLFVFFINIVVNTRNVLGKVGVLLAEARIEVLGNLLRIDDEARLHLFLHIYNGGVFIQGETKVFHLLEEEVCFVG